MATLPTYVVDGTLHSVAIPTFVADGALHSPALPAFVLDGTLLVRAIQFPAYVLGALRTLFFLPTPSLITAFAGTVAGTGGGQAVLASNPPGRVTGTGGGGGTVSYRVTERTTVVGTGDGTAILTYRTSLLHRIPTPILDGSLRSRGLGTPLLDGAAHSTLLPAYVVDGALIIGGTRLPPYTLAVTARAIVGTGGGSATLTLSYRLVVVTGTGGGSAVIAFKASTSVTGTGGGSGAVAWFTKSVRGTGGGSAVVVGVMTPVVLFSHTLENALRVAFVHTFENGSSVFFDHEIQVYFSASFEHTFENALQGRAQFDHEVINALTTRVQFAHTVANELRTNNTGSFEHEIRNSLSSTTVIALTGAPFLMHQGRRVELTELTISQDENDGLWTAAMGVLQIADALRLVERDAVTLDIYGDEYALVVETLGRARRSRTERSFVVNCKSPAWLKLGSKATPITKTWGAVSARAAVEEIVGAAVEWSIIDWTIPVGKLTAVGAIPLTVVQSIVKAAGGVVESKRDGTLRVRYRYPVAIPDVPAATPDHFLAEGKDVWRYDISSYSGQSYNRIALANGSEQDGFLTAEDDPANPQTVLGGEQRTFFVFTDDRTEVVTVIASDGTVFDRGTQLIPVEETLRFDNTNTVEITKPVHSGFTVVSWYGTNLGALTVSGRTLTAAAVGVAIVKVKYVAQARVYALQAPLTSGGETSFPVAIYVVGALK